MERTIQSDRESSDETGVLGNPAHDHKTSITSRQAKSEGVFIEITSATNFENPSRESSPIRPNKLYAKKTYPTPSSSVGAGAAAAASPSRSRKNSVPDVNPHLSTNPPSAAATQRALSIRPLLALHPISPDPLSRTFGPQKSLMSPDFRENPPRWPISPRLRSPPPIILNPVSGPRKIDAEQSSISLKKLHLTEEDKPTLVDSEGEELPLIPGMRTPARGVSGTSSTLETVQEISQPGTPASGQDENLEEVTKIDVQMAPEQRGSQENNSPKTIKPKSSRMIIEGTCEGMSKTENNERTSAAALPSSTRPTGIHTKSYSSSGLARGKASSEGSTRNMTVETETVCSIPQMAVGPGGPGNVGSIRTKPSSETIRPRKEKKKTIRKPPSVTSGTVAVHPASSKADIFEAKVASAVDEANSSDSEETFVYESNPPDASDRSRRFHSRTPSAASMASQVDQRNGIRAALDGHIVVVKKSMKFTNSYNSSAPDAMTGDDAGKGTARSSLGTARGASHHHHHLNIRWGRHAGNSHPSLFDNESPFHNTGLSKLMGSSSRVSSRPSSPGNMNPKTPLSGKKVSSTGIRYDMEHSPSNAMTPLLSTVRSGTSGRSRRHNGSIRQLEHQSNRRRQKSLSRCGGCFSLCIMVALIITGVAGFIFATTQPLTNVKVLALKNVLVSEQDIIFDMQVQARNPNLVAVTIQYTDLTIFANSRYVGPNAKYRDRPEPIRKLRRGFRSQHRDSPSSSTEEISRPSINLEIGHVSMLDNPLTFEGLPFSNACSTATSQISVRSPGNYTSPAGSERWEKILQHEFDLILRGILKYTLPLNQKIRSISIEGRVSVKPNLISPTDDDAMQINFLAKEQDSRA